MRLDMGIFQVREVEFSDRTGFDEGVLSINKTKLIEHLTTDSGFQRVEVDVVYPGEDARIVHAMDIVEPQVKASSPGAEFPGVLGRPGLAGEGRTHRLAGLAVVGTAEPFAGEEYWYAREAVIDMSGPGASYSPFSKTINLVLTFVSEGGADSDAPQERLNYEVDYRNEEAEAKTRMARGLGLKAASYLARTVKDREPDSWETYELSPVDGALPRIVYIQQNLSGRLYGAGDGFRNNAILLHPNELMDGALVNDFWWSHASMRDATYLYQNNAIIRRLYSLHGKEIDFAGVILFHGAHYKLEDKERETSE
ncbi:MAG: glycine/sarcosine/betaine reductase component B subunit, partial [Dehalococcoidia bacterium]